MSKTYKKKYTKEQILGAIEKSGGIVRNVAKKLNCQWHTADKYINMWQQTKQAFSDEEEKILDAAETTILNSIIEGNTQDAKWYLAKKGKKRGYSDEIDLGGEVDVKVNIVEPKNWDEHK